MFWICLKICCPQGRTGSSPVGGTLSKLNLVNKKPAVCGPFCFASISFAGWFSINNFCFPGWVKQGWWCFVAILVMKCRKQREECWVETVLKKEFITGRLWLKNRNTEYEIVGYLPVWKIRWFMAPWKKGNAAGVENSRRHVCGSGCGMRCRRMVHLFRFRGQDCWAFQGCSRSCSCSGVRMLPNIHGEP